MKRSFWGHFGWIFGTIIGSILFGASYSLFLSPCNLNAGGIKG